MAKNDKGRERAKGKQVGGKAEKWIDGDDVVGTLVSADATKTKHGDRACIVIERENTGEHEARFMPLNWASKLQRLIGKRIGIARDGVGMACTYDVREL